LVKKENYMKCKFNIRKAVQADIPAIVELWKEFMDFHKERDSFFSRSAIGHEKFAEFCTGQITNESSYVLVAESDDQVIGYCLATISKYPPVYNLVEYGQIMDLAITNKYRRSGIGKALVNAAQCWFSAHNVNRLEARVAVSNEISTAFWRKMGFMPYIETLCKKI
jgi:ribosomal protein S18 acetylase RimI-like enzyme